MNNYVLKKILTIIDKKETLFTNLLDLNEMLCNDPELGVTHKEIHELLVYLYDQKFILQRDTLELRAPITLYARSKINSLCESICLFECLLQDPKFREFYVLNKNNSFSGSKIYALLEKHRVLKYAFQHASIITNHHNKYYFTKDIKKVGDYIINEMDTPSYIVSTIAITHYIDSIIDFSASTFRNEDKYIVKYKHLPYILRQLPQRGIPQNRSLSESLQNFYKDTLMQEYESKCPICGIHIPHMLIASHIKPFRDCAHLIESSDYSNGILLCKNHDFLFDQGYISFDDDGKIMICSELSAEDYTAMHLSLEFRMPKHLMTVRRKMFLDYHRKTYFKG